jgi:hypothetical protein
MAISIGIKRIVVLSDYTEDASCLLSKANVTLLKLESGQLYNWIRILKKDWGTLARAEKRKAGS